MSDNMGKYSSITNRYFKIYINNKLKKYELQALQIPILLKIKEGKCTQETINQTLHIDKGVLCRLTKDLLEKGYITKYKHPEDKRAYLLELTEKGNATIPYLNKYVKEWHEYVFKGFGEQEIAFMMEAMKRIATKSYNLVYEQEGEYKNE